MGFDHNPKCKVEKLPNSPNSANIAQKNQDPC